jgi:hypothetical protein
MVLVFVLPLLPVANAAVQNFVDDFQAPEWCANYQVTLNHRRACVCASFGHGLLPHQQN